MIPQPSGDLDLANGDLPFASMGDLGLDRRKVTQCALSRVCGGCGGSLARPVAFLGSALEADRNAFHFPAMHPACADQVLARWGSDAAALGHTAAPSQWALVTTSGFEFVRPTPEWEDPRPVFEPNSVIEDRRLTTP